MHYWQKSRSSSKGSGSTSSSDQDKTKKIFSPEEFLKLPAGSCVFINPAYANQYEASVPMKLKIKVGDGEIQRRAYGEANFKLVIKELKKRNQQAKVTSKDIEDRIKALNCFIPSESEKKQVILNDVQGVVDDIMSDMEDIL